MIAKNVQLAASIAGVGPSLNVIEAMLSRFPDTCNEKTILLCDAMAPGAAPYGATLGFRLLASYIPLDPMRAKDLKSEEFCAKKQGEELD